MTGFALLPTAPEEGPEQHGQKFKGVSRILGPKWAQLPVITVGLLGVQMFWSVEASYGVYLLVTQNVDRSQFMTCQLPPTCLPWDYPSQAWLLSLLRDRFPDLSCNR